MEIYLSAKGRVTELTLVSGARVGSGDGPSAGKGMGLVLGRSLDLGEQLSGLPGSPAQAAGDSP